MEDLSTDCGEAEGYGHDSWGPHIYWTGEGGHGAVRGLQREAGQHHVVGSYEAKPREGRAGPHWEHRLRNGWLVCVILGQGFTGRAPPGAVQELPLVGGRQRETLVSLPCREGSEGRRGLEK